MMEYTIIAVIVSLVGLVFYLVLSESRRIARVQRTWEEAAQRLIALRMMVDSNEVEARVMSIKEIYDQVYREAVSRLVSKEVPPEDNAGYRWPEYDYGSESGESSKPDTKGEYFYANRATSSSPLPIEEEGTP